MKGGQHMDMAGNTRNAKKRLFPEKLIIKRLPLKRKTGIW
jgi:hypothetical protein